MIAFALNEVIRDKRDYPHAWAFAVDGLRRADGRRSRQHETNRATNRRALFDEEDIGE